MSESGECEYQLEIKMLLSHRLPPKDTEEKFFRENMQIHIDGLVNDFLDSQLNKQNLANRILGNTGILIGP